MPQVTFYLLSSSTLTREQFACRLIDKAWQKNCFTHIQTCDSSASEQLDHLLWYWREDSFIPHEIIHSNSQPVAPVTISHTQPDISQKEILVNLTPDLPVFYQQFQRVCEIVTTEHAQESREKYRLYREAGMQLQTHQIA